MSYTISISGHKETSSEAASREFEESVKTLAVEFVSTLEGVTGASGTFGALGNVNLLEEANAE